MDVTSATNQVAAGNPASTGAQLAERGRKRIERRKIRRNRRMKVRALRSQPTVGGGCLERREFKRIRDAAMPASAHKAHLDTCARCRKRASTAIEEGRSRFHNRRQAKEPMPMN
jgi:hypothetical protein